MKKADKKTSQTSSDSPIVKNSQFSLAFPWEKVNEVIQSVLRKYQARLKTDGFRKGKAPLPMVEKMVDPQTIRQEVAHQLVPMAYAEYVKKHDLKPFGDPDIHLHEAEEGKEWVFEVNYAEKPSIELPDYKKLVQKAQKAFADKKKKDKKADKKTEAEEKAEKDELIQEILQELRTTINPKIPELLVRNEMNRTLRSLEEQLTKANLDPKVYLQSIGKTMEETQQEHATRAIVNWQVELILEKIAEVEEITITDEELQQKLQVTAEQFKSLSPDMIGYYRSLLKKEKVLDFLTIL